MSERMDRFTDLAAAYLLGALEDDELRELQALIKDADPGMLEAFRRLEEAALHLPASAPPADPPPSARAAILAAVRNEAASDKPEGEAPGLLRRLRLHRPQLAAAAVAVLILLLAGAGLVIQQLRGDLHRSRARIVELENELERQEQLLAVLRARDVEYVRLEGMADDSPSHGKILWDVRRRVAVLQVANLPPVGEDETYQLWVYPREGRPVSAGVFAVRDPGQAAFFRLERFTAFEEEAIKGLVISVEPAGGADEPADRERWVLGARFHAGNGSE